MAAAQPFISGAISKTVNLPENATVDDIMNTYVEGWRLGLKSIAIYRDGSKRSAPLNTTQDTATWAERVDGGMDVIAEPRRSPETHSRIGRRTRRCCASRLDQPVRHRMPDTRMSLTHRFEIAGHEGYITVGLVRRRPAGRTLHHDVEGRQHDWRVNGYGRHADVDCACNTACRWRVW